MDWDQWFCPNQYCAVEVWMVQQCPTARETWWVTGRFGGTTYTIAAIDPICPRCGTTLCTTVEIGHTNNGADILEAGPVFDFVRSLR
jgi:hypothetical protein